MYQIKIGVTFIYFMVFTGELRLFVYPSGLVHRPLKIFWKLSCHILIENKKSVSAIDPEDKSSDQLARGIKLIGF